jgi:hypothetical protein
MVERMKEEEEEEKEMDEEEREARWERKAREAREKLNMLSKQLSEERDAFDEKLRDHEELDEGEQDDEMVERAGLHAMCMKELLTTVGTKDV